MLEDIKATPKEAFLQARGLVVTQDYSLRAKLAALLEPLDHRVKMAQSPEEGLRLAAECEFDLVVLDISDCGRRPLRLLRSIRDTRPIAKVLTITDPSDMHVAVTAIKLGGFDLLAKPLDEEMFLAAARRAMQETPELLQKSQGRFRRTRFPDGKLLLGQSEAMCKVLKKIEMVKGVNSNVLILGETGTGKELVARAIHSGSLRAAGPFVKLNCGAIPKDLLESELFGHEKGAFTGALQQRIGRFEMADGGTILLDEIGDMPLDLQVKLLGVIQDREVQRVGGHEKIPVDVRIIAATHQDLLKAISEKRFRQDLYYRLNVIPISVPPLSQRKDDISLLVEHFLKFYCQETGRSIKGLDPEAMRLLLGYNYSGNVRELENIIESSVVLCSGETITPEDLPSALMEGGSAEEDLVMRPGMPLREVERLHVIETLRYTKGNKRRAAELLGITRQAIYRKIEQYKITPDWQQKGGPGRAA